MSRAMWKSGELTPALMGDPFTIDSEREGEPNEAGRQPYAPPCLRAMWRSGELLWPDENVKRETNFTKV